VSLTNYIKAIDDGKIPSMNNLHSRAELLRLLTEVGDNKRNRSEAVKLAMNLFDNDREFLAMIPSEQTRHILTSLTNERSENEG
jgi:hypothetical protein